MKKVEWKLFYPGIAAAVTLLCPSITIFLNNRSQFTLDGLGAAGMFLAAGATIWGICTITMVLCRREQIRLTLHAAWLAFALSMALHYGFWIRVFPDDPNFEWDFTDILTLFLIVVHILFLLLPFGLAFRFRNWIWERAGKLTAVIVLPQLAVLAEPVFSAEESPDYDFRSYSISEQDKFTFSSDRNIILLVVDCMGERICKETLRKYPEVVAALKDFTVFDRMESPLGRTMYAVPAMLTGIDFPRTEDNQPGDIDHGEYLNRVCRDPASVFQLCRRNGIRFEAYPFVLNIISYAPDVIDNSIEIDYETQKQSLIKIADTALEQQVPFYLKPLLRKFYYIATDPFVTPAQKTVRSPEAVFDRVFYSRLDHDFKVTGSGGRFKYFHLHGAHEPVRTDENLELNPASLKYKQLRGSLKNVELLLEKMKRAGIYDRSMIVIVGDHTERYTPEVIAFVKRPMEHHDAPVFNSTPCQVSDIAGTFAKSCGLDPQARSLFDLPFRAGSLNSVRGKEFAAARDFPVWQPDEAPREVGPELYPHAFLLEKDRLVFDIGHETFGDAEKFTLTAEDMRSGKKFSAKLDLSGNFSYLRSDGLRFPDGCYRIFLRIVHRPGLGSMGEKFYVLPSYLILRNGRPELSEKTAFLQTRALQIGESIEFEPMMFPAPIVLSKAAEISSNYLILPKNAPIGIRLPATEPPLALELTVRKTSQGSISFFIDGKKLAEQEIPAVTPLVKVIPLPAQTGNVVQLQMDFRPRLGNREENPDDNLQLLKIRLLETR
ncbi:MAG: hypothetical protein J5806_11940 [Lentisphaeria bacterium]|nr:hypothetical protein [Lentisphaeria bacterium]